MKRISRFHSHGCGSAIKASLYCTVAAIALLSAGSVAQAQGSADTDTESMETVVVTGQRAAISAAIDIKKNADVIVDTVAAEDVGKLPDNSVTEVLQRLPGVNISRIQTGSGSENYLGEGTGITIRGLTSTVSLLNGRDSFSASSGRNLAWEDIPPELAQGIDVFKSLSATLPEGGFGGVINLRSRQPFDFDGFTANVTVGGNYADFSKKGHPGGGLMLSDRWHTGIGNMGLLLNITYSDLATKADGVQVLPYFPTVYNETYANSHGTSLPSLSDDGSSEVYVPGGFGITRANADRVRLGLYMAAQWQPLDDLLLGVTIFRSRYTMNTLTYSMYLGSGISTYLSPNSTNTFDDDGNLTYTNGLSSFMYGFTGVGLSNEGTWGYEPIPYTMQTQYSHQVNVTNDISVTADWMPTDDFNAKFALQYVDSSADQQDYSADLFAFVTGYSMSLSSYGSSTLPHFDFPSNSLDFSNAANYGWEATMPHKMHNYGREVATYLDTTYTISDSAFFRKLQSGLKFTSRGENDNETEYVWKELSPWYIDSSYSVHTLDEDSSLGTKVDLSDMYGGALGLPSAIWFPSKKAAMSTADLQSKYNDADNFGDAALAQFSKYTMASVNETTATGYAMLTFADDDMLPIPFNGNFGVRIVAYRDHAKGYRFTPELTNSYLDADGTVTISSDKMETLVNGGHSEVDVLPSLNLQFLPTDQTHIRFAFSQAVSRPTFSQMNPRGYVTGTYMGTYVSYFSGSWGNPDLKPEKAEQIDLSVEYYFPSGGMVHLAGFWKQIHNFIAQKQANIPTTFDVTVDAGSLDDSSYCSGTGTTGTCTVNASVTEYFNESSAAKIQGYEFGIQKYATFLPAPFDGFGLDFNYTYIDSQQPGALAYDMKGNAMSGLPVTGLSKNTLNISGMYDKGPLSLRLAYNWRSHFLVSTAAWQTSGTYNNVENVNYGSTEPNGDVITYALPVYQYSMGTLDANMSYQLADNISLTMEASNLTRSTARLYMDETEVGSGTQRLENRSWYQADTRYSMNLRMKF